MRRFAKKEAEMRKFADGSKAPLPKAKRKGKKIKSTHFARAGARTHLKNAKMWKQTKAKKV